MLILELITTWEVDIISSAKKRFKTNSGDATVGDIRRVSSIYDKKQCRIIHYTGKHTNGRLTMEQLLEALTYTTPESI
ncbi:hypothetical protein T01_1014 [Trichinella spiralis]|uniref:Uncharacterized protein n=1 Tax=Trichinella spiralis TaxID=6334 RepID=A0A0V1B0W9_TRISP|nr:hypothetical protein T01_1014 [Trichinella spiralis]